MLSRYRIRAAATGALMGMFLSSGGAHLDDPAPFELAGLSTEHGGVAPRSIATLVAGLFSALGIIALVSVILRW